MYIYIYKFTNLCLTHTWQLPRRIGGQFLDPSILYAGSLGLYYIIVGCALLKCHGHGVPWFSEDVGRISHLVYFNDHVHSN